MAVNVTQSAYMRIYDVYSFLCLFLSFILSFLPLFFSFFSQQAGSSSSDWSCSRFLAVIVNVAIKIKWN